MKAKVIGMPVYYKGKHYKVGTTLDIDKSFADHPHLQTSKDAKDAQADQVVGETQAGGEADDTAK